MIIVAVNGETHRVTAGVTVAGLLAALQVPTEGVAVAVDAAVVPRTSWDRVVVDGDEIEVLCAVPGG
ncbi:sulfur carrier protein ThiS [Nakamurella leprariae]|uniref:Sulfur carrier protein ThiS n=1 Tax=Nakamurella leprariae TaxID=2803911 RepID=A0A939C401_9ACTN|nr:sulfur carrier protein ThiS [Nakamurella leprariae]MBM9469587.1 sulfur carrier protein ThiS [Nakamurella leprariae]